MTYKHQIVNLQSKISNLKSIISRPIRPSKKLRIFYSKLFRKNLDLTDRQCNLIGILLSSPKPREFLFLKWLALA